MTIDTDRPTITVGRLHELLGTQLKGDDVLLPTPYNHFAVVRGGELIGWFYLNEQRPGFVAVTP